MFDDVRYGGRPGSRQGYERLRDLDAAIMSARTASVAAIGAAPGPGPAAVAARYRGHGDDARPAPGDTAPAGPAGPDARRPAAGPGLAGPGPAGAGQQRPGGPAAGAPGRASRTGNGPAGPGGSSRPRWRVPAGIGVFVVLAVIVAALLRPAGTVPGYLSPQGTGAFGARAVADLLAARGHRVQPVTTVSAAVERRRAGHHARDHQPVPADPGPGPGSRPGAG